MTEPAEPTTAKRPRYSRAEATQMFLDAAIAVVGTKPLPEITMQELADAVGLNHGYVHRYFGTRLDLFEAVADELARRVVEVVGAEQRRRLEEDGGPGELDRSLLDLARPLAAKRTAIVQYLVISGVPQERFAEATRMQIQLSIDNLMSMGVSERMATAQSIKAIALLWAQATYVRALGVTSEEAADVEAVTLLELADSSMTAEKLGW